MKSNAMVNEKTEAKTLRELGIDGALAAELESALRLMGAVKGGRIAGYTFVTPDGQCHALRAEKADGSLARAA